MIAPRIIFGIMLAFAVIILIYLTSALFKFFYQSRHVYHPLKEIFGTPLDTGLDFEEKMIENPDGIKISSWYVPAKKEGRVVLFFHGQGGNISTRLDFLKILHGAGLSIFMVDYRGFGKSEGVPDEAGTYADAETSWEYLTKIKKVAPSRIIIYGRSLGGVIAANLAAKVKPAALVLDSTFTSIKDIAKNLYPYFPVRKFIRFKYDTVEHLTKVRCPILVMHSREDDYIPYSHARRLFEVAGEPKDFLEIKGGHGRNYMVSMDIIKKGLKKFISEFL